MSCRRKLSRSGCSATSPSSSPMTSPWRPSSRSASIRSARAASRSSSSLRISGCAKFWNANSESAGPRHELERTHEKLASLSAGSRRASASERSNGAHRPARARCEDIAGRTRLQNIRAQHLPELTDAVLKRCHRRLRRALAPEEVDKSIGRDDTARRESENREQRALPLTPERDRAGLVRDLERPEYPEIERDGRP